MNPEEPEHTKENYTIEDESELEEDLKWLGSLLGE
jgi:hypothetical protein